MNLSEFETRNNFKIRYSLFFPMFMTLIGCFLIFITAKAYPSHPNASDIGFLRQCIIFSLCIITIPFVIFGNKIKVSGNYIEYLGLFSKTIISELNHISCRKFWIFNYVVFGSKKNASFIFSGGWICMFLIKASDYKMSEAMLLDFQQLETTNTPSSNVDIDEIIEKPLQAIQKKEVSYDVNISRLPGIILMLFGVIFLFFIVFDPTDRQFLISKIFCAILCIVTFYGAICFITQSANIEGDNLEYKNIFYSIYIKNIQYISYQRGLIYGTITVVGTESGSNSGLIKLINKVRNNSLVIPFVVNYKEIVERFNDENKFS